MSGESGDPIVAGIVDKFYGDPTEPPPPPPGTAWALVSAIDEACQREGIDADKARASLVEDRDGYVIVLATPRHREFAWIGSW